MKRRWDPLGRFVRRLGDRPRILDLGCGGGHSAQVVMTVAPDAIVTGVDIDQPASASALAEFVQCDLNAASLPFEAESFDAVILSHVVEHLQQPFLLGAEIGRVLKPGGQVYVEAPNWVSMFVPSFGGWLPRDHRGPFNFFDDHTHLCPWTRQKMHEFLRFACGLRDVKVRSARNWFELPFDPLLLVLLWLARRRRHSIAVLCNLIGWAVYGTGRKTDATRSA